MPSASVSGSTAATPVVEKVEPMTEEEKPDAQAGETLTMEQCMEIIQKLKTSQQGWLANTSR